MNNIQVFQMDYMYKTIAEMQKEIKDLINVITNLRAKENISMIDICGLKERYNYLEETSVANITKIQYLEEQNKQYETRYINMKKVVVELTSKQAYDTYTLNKKLDDLLASNSSNTTKGFRAITPINSQNTATCYQSASPVNFVSPVNSPTKDNNSRHPPLYTYNSYNPEALALAQQRENAAAYSLEIWARKNAESFLAST